MSGDPVKSSCDVAVVGAGILGLAAARELIRRHPRLQVTVLEKEREVGCHQTGHNSGVVHAGIYYAPESLKARLCVTGARELYDYCEERGIAHERCGKLIVATRRAELPALDELERRGRANGVPGLRRLDARGLERIEPHARGLAALHSPHTGIADFAAVARAFAEDVVEAGGTVLTGCAVRALRDRRRAGRVPRDPHGGVTIEHARGELHARAAIACAGAWADRLAVAAGAPADPRIVPFRGAYLRLRPERRGLVRALIYPVPDPELPFLGVHLTRHTSGDVMIGPTALLAPARDAYSLRTIRRHDLAEALGWPGTWRMARRFWRTGLTELAFATSRRALVAAAARFVPELGPRDVLPGPAGVRAQAVGRDGRLVDDFVFSRTGAVLHVRNAPSPAATSSLAIAREIADQADAALGLAR
jgi:(S)-2-hydroxyglutarate dehydrogenase